MNDLEKQFGRIDIYLFDQFLRGNIRHGAIFSTQKGGQEMPKKADWYYFRNG
jgi:hypothetical protein